MKQIFNCNKTEIREYAKEYSRLGVFSRVVQCYERLLYIGNLRKNEHLRLAVIYTRQGKENQAKRIISRYKQIYKII